MHLRRSKPNGAKGEHATDEPVRHLGKGQVTALLRAAAGNPRLLALVSLLYESGARIAEALALDLAGVDLAARQFQVVGKGNKLRWCFFGDSAEATLRAYLDGGRHHPHRSLFTERGAYRNDIRPLSYPLAYRDLREAVKGHTALQGVRFHDLRHTFATERASMVPLEVLRALMGHESIQTTLMYQKVTSAVAREAAHEALRKLAR
jgi:integrase/recombinase XerD